MNSVIAPIKPEQQDELVTNLQQILFFFIEYAIIKIDGWDNMISDFKTEQDKQFYGKITATIVMYFRIQKNLGDGRDVDEATAKSINSLLDKVDDKLIISGVVLSVERKPVADILVKAFKKNIRSEDLIDQGRTAMDGRYTIPYTLGKFNGGEKNNAGVVVIAYDTTGLEISRSNGTGNVDIDIILPDPAANLSEYNKMILGLAPAMKSLSFEELTEKDIDFLAENTGFPRDHISLLKLAFVTASKFKKLSDSSITITDEKNLRIPIALFYGWFRQALPTEPHALFSLSANELEKYIVTAIKTNIISEIENDLIEVIKNEISKLNTEILLHTSEDALPSLGDVLNTIPVKLPFDKQLIVASVLQNKNNPEISLAEKLKTAGLEDNQVIDVERTFAFQSFSGNFLPLIKTLQEDKEVKSLRDLALLNNRENFTQKIIDNNAYPDGEKAEDFAGKLYNNLFEVEPTAMLRNMLEDPKATLVEDASLRTNVNNFLKNIPDTFNIKTTSVYHAFKYENAFEGIAPELQDKIKAELKSLQRVLALSPAPEVVSVLMKANVTTSLLISDMPEDQFVQSFSKQLGANGETVARQVHVNAVNARIRNEQALISLKELKEGTGISMVDKAMRNGFDENGSLHNKLIENNLSWDLLFGDAYFCECDECTSVYSAAAYFVDLLQYLRNNNLDPAKPSDPTNIYDTPLQKLFNRRPDLMCLQLTCKNTSTILPYVDLVNEVMESYVAFKRTLSFNVTKDETSGELMSQPQHTEDAAYKILQDAVYPFALPYHQPVDAARIYLNSLGTSRYELINTFRSAGDNVNVLEPLNYDKQPTLLIQLAATGLDELYTIYLNNTADAEFLELTQEEYIILTKEAFVSKEYWDKQTNIHTPEEYSIKIKVKPVYEYYGYKSEEDMLSTDESKGLGLTFVKDQFLKRTGVQYTELVELLKTQCLFPAIPQEQSLGILESIRFSYSFLQTLIYPDNYPKKKYERLLGLLIPALLRGNNDPCKLDEAPLTEEDVKKKKEEENKKVAYLTQWVYDYFEMAGNIIVLDNNIKCIDGDLSTLNGSDAVRVGFIKDFKIYGELEEVVGSINKTTGLITMEPGQAVWDWANITFTSHSTDEVAGFVKIVEKSYFIRIIAKPDTCDLDTVRLIHLDGSPLTVDEYDRFHRFIRLRRKLGWTINETDNAIVSLSTNNDCNISPHLLHQLTAVKKLSEKTGLELIKLLSFWTNISITGELSLYKRLFLTHNLKSIDNVFHADNGYYLAGIPEKIGDHEPVLMAALNLKADDIEAIVEHEKIEDLTIDNVSKLYRYRLLSKILGLKVTDFISVLPLFGNPFTNADATLFFMEQWGRIEDAGFNYAQLNYIIRGEDDLKKPLALSKKTALQLAKILYEGLNAIEEAHQDLKSNPDTTDLQDQATERHAQATSEVVKQKTALLYDQDTAENIAGILEGTTIYSIKSPTGLKDLLTPVPLVAAATTQDYAYLQFDKYPLIRKKIKYDSTKGTLQIKGILTELEKNGSSLFLMEDFIDVLTLVQKLINNADAVSAYLFGIFSATGQTKLRSTTITIIELQNFLSEEFNIIINRGTSIAPDISTVLPSVVTKTLMNKNPPVSGDDLIRLNRMLLEDAYPNEIAKNQRVGLNTILDNLQPALSLKDSLAGIKNQQEKLIDVIFKGTFDPIEIAFLSSGDINDIPIDAITNIKNNTAPVKRLKFLKIFLPYLRKELTHRFIVGTLSTQSGLTNEITDLLITEILKTDSLSISAYNLFEQINKVIEPNYNRWKGDLTPTAEGQYTFIIKNSYTKPNLNVDGQPIHFIVQTNSLDEWWSDEKTLLPNQQYKLELYRTNPENLYWKNDKFSIAPLPSAFSLSAWDGYLIPSLEEQYTFIVKGSNAKPVVSIDGVDVNFTEQTNPSDEWWSDVQKLLVGKRYKLLLAGMNMVNVYWKTSQSSVISIPSSVIMQGWDGYLIPSAGGEYTFIVKGSIARPDLSLDDNPVTFTEQPNSPGEWWSNAEKLQAGKVYKLFLPEVNMENIYWKTGTSSITTIPSASLLPGYVEHNTMKAFIPLQKVALLVNGFKLSADEIKYISNHPPSNHPPDFENLNFNEIQLKQFLRLEAYTRLRNSLPVTKINILDFFKWTYSQADSTLDEKIEELTGRKKESIAKLIDKKHFNLLQPELFRNEINLLKLMNAMEVANKISVNIDLLFDWAKPGSSFDDCRNIANSIQHAIRSQYNQEDWEQVVKPLNDKLRENQKNALIAYLLLQEDIFNWGVTDADGLFEFFLIDVQMDACMETSRIKQAISSVQLFVQRCFLGLEEEQRHSGIKSNVLDRKRWDWMQRYRVWEANRKIFLYPENWIESNLRDDKSSFFKELEGELLQKDINKQNVEDALKAYLYKVDEVANMEVIGVYIEMATDINGNTTETAIKLHVFSRTRIAPYFFFYRYLDIAGGNNWNPWEKMQVDIPNYDVEVTIEIIKIAQNIYELNPKYKTIIGNGCYLTPIVWNGRLLIFFPQFVRKTKPNEDVAGSKSIRDMSEDSTDSAKPIEYWEIKMAWSEYRNGKWTQKQLSKDAVYDIPALDGFWKVFNAAGKVRANAKTTADNYTDKFNLAWFKRKRWIEFSDASNLVHAFSSSNFFGGLSRADQQKVLDFFSPQNQNNWNTPASHNKLNEKLKTLGTDSNNVDDAKKNAWDNYVKAWDQEKDAKDIADTAADQVVVNNYIKQLQTLPPPAPAADISKYEFAPVISKADIKIEIFYDSNVNRTGIFRFDGSNLVSVPVKDFPAVNIANGVNTFHHYGPTWPYVNLSVIQSLQPSTAITYSFDDLGKTIFRSFLPTLKIVNFYHSDSNNLIGVINSQQLESFFKFPIEGINHNPDKDDVFGGYDNDASSITPNIYHELKRPYSLYNWELFFHIPMMLADALSKSQQFEEAMKWYHYVFNPVAEGPEVNRFWQFSPFKDADAKHILNDIFNKLTPNTNDDDINEWRNNPFKPHLVARSRPVAYMKWVVMKYVDNLVAWGDYLFRQDTIESINQATQLYVLAGHILGPRPQMIPKRGTIKTQTYLSLLDKWDAFSNAMTELELAMPYSNQTPLPVGISNGVIGLANVFGFSSSTYFCIPNNPKLISYWDTISDRLFKIRHCENIEGLFRKLPLFEPPIDPALLVKAAAQGLSIASVLNDLNTPMPNYRFYYLLQKALELCNELKSLGSAMLYAIEKKDNETISLIRSKHETGMLNLVMEIKKQQLEEAQKSLEGLKQNRKSPEHRMKYYLQLIGEDAGKVPNADSDFSEIANAIETPIDESGLKLIKYEKEDMDMANLSAGLQLAAGIPEVLAGILWAIPNIAADVKPFGLGAGATFGGSNLGQLTEAVSKGLQISATYLSHQSSSAAKKGGFLRAMQDRVMQANSAGYEIKQIDKQILSQQIRIGIANLEITNQQKQIDNANEIEDFLINKYSNEELYSWMKGSLSTLYHQVYSIAFDLAKKAEKVYRFERGMTSSNFIQAGYWDAGYNGLLAGERLYVGLKQLEAAYQENRGYDYEITKHISLRQLDPYALLQLKAGNKCEFDLPEVLFDMDYPGHYKRRIKSVSISIPCIAGPYTSVNATLRLLNNKFRNSAIGTNYKDQSEEKFINYNIPITAIATSSAQNDSGMFELNFKDERYLPFEGAGIISGWRLELPDIKQFDYNTISDVVLHVKYIASEGGESLKSVARNSVISQLNVISQQLNETGLHIPISLKHDMPKEWNLLVSKGIAEIEINKTRLPYVAQAIPLSSVQIRLVAKPNISRLQSDISPGIDFIFNPITGTDLYISNEITVSFNKKIKLYGYNNGITNPADVKETDADKTELSLLDDIIIMVKYLLT